MCRAPDDDYDAWRAIVGREGIMVEREQGQRADRAADQVAADELGGTVDLAGASELKGSKEDAEFERAMEIGRKVMSDHHAVLAALAK
jgi:hypothetical protein